VAAEYDGVDALMAAITGEPLPEGAYADAAFLAEHRAARADVALLREQLAIIGDTLAGPEPEPEPLPGPEPRPEPVAVPRPTGKRSRRRGAQFGLGVLVAAVLAAAVVGSGWLVAQSGRGVDDSAASKAADTGAGESKSSEAGYLACARLVVEGRVSDVRRVSGSTRYRITLAVEHYYKPGTGKAEVTFLMDQDSDPLLGKGEHALIGIPSGSAVPDRWTTAEVDIARERAAILAALPASRTTRCTP